MKKDMRTQNVTPASGKAPSMQDDEKDDQNSFQGNYEELDNTMKGLFYVADPSNSFNLNIRFPFVDDKKWGYNDLLRRKNKLCAFLVNGCNGVLGEQNNPSSMTLIRSIAFIPLPLAGH